MAGRFTRRCVPGKYRMPLLTGKEMFLVEAAGEQTARKQRNSSVPDAYFGQAVDKLGQYEEIGEPEEIMDKLQKLEELERGQI